MSGAYVARLTDCSPRPPPYFLLELDLTEYDWTETQEYLLCTLPKVASKRNLRLQISPSTIPAVRLEMEVGASQGLRAVNDPTRKYDDSAAILGITRRLPRQVHSSKLEFS